MLRKWLNNVARGALARSQHTNHTHTHRWSYISAIVPVKNNWRINFASPLVPISPLILRDNMIDYHRSTLNNLAHEWITKRNTHYIVLEMKKKIKICILNAVRCPLQQWQHKHIASVYFILKTASNVATAKMQLQISHAIIFTMLCYRHCNSQPKRAAATLFIYKFNIFGVRKFNFSDIHPFHKFTFIS